MHLLVSELRRFQNARSNDKNFLKTLHTKLFSHLELRTLVNCVETFLEKLFVTQMVKKF